MCHFRERATSPPARFGRGNSRLTKPTPRAALPDTARGARACRASRAPRRELASRGIPREGCGQGMRTSADAGRGWRRPAFFSACSPAVPSAWALSSAASVRYHGPVFCRGLRFLLAQPPIKISFRRGESVPSKESLRKLSPLKIQAGKIIAQKSAEGSRRFDVSVETNGECNLFATPTPRSRGRCSRHVRASARSDIDTPGAK